ncbi:hypothetical protein N9D23_07730 [Rubripirellula sp.]|jgi:hypothetical protein|nr:hypothetical protein [Planctomycetaceae bacterium]MDA9857996.1 hypothetical protein [Rubripirellula sp.]
MGDKNQGKIRRRVSGLAILVVLGYVGSYTPSLLAWWEETWYPHGRESRIVKPDPNAVVYQLVMPDDGASLGKWNQEVDAWSDDSPLVIQKQSPSTTPFGPALKSLNANEQEQMDQRAGQVLNFGMHPRATGETS